MGGKTQVARTLNFSSLDDIVAEARQIAADDQARPCGNWTPAQNIWHVGRLLDYSVEGFPFKAPLIFRLVLPLLKNRFLAKTFKPGIKAPPQIAKYMIPAPDTTIQQAMGLLESAREKQKSKGFVPASPLFGRLTADQWEQLHCRHAELHLGMIERS